MLSQQGVRPGHINMGRILRQIKHRSDQSRKVTYHRPPIYGKDNYGVEVALLLFRNFYIQNYQL